MAAAGVPTARRPRLRVAERGRRRPSTSFGPPYVVKDDGLAAGKGVVVTEDRDAAARARRAVRAGSSSRSTSTVRRCRSSRSPTATTVYPLQPAQDFKRIFDGDEGPNTGGMGAYTPLPWAPEGLVDEVLDSVAAADGRRDGPARGTPFAGLLYAGLALTSQGVRVVEFNARFGDPETQPLLALLDSPLAELLKAAADGTPARGRRRRAGRSGAAVAVVMASAGYPEGSSKGDVIVGTETLAEERDVDVIHAGTAQARRRPGHRRRSGARRDGGGRRRRRRPGQGLRGHLLDQLRRRPVAHRHRSGRCPSRPTRRRSPDDCSQRARHPVRRRGPCRDLVARAQDRARAAAVDRRADGAEGPRRRRARRRDRGLRGRRREGRPGQHRRPRAGDPARREGADRGVLRARRPRAHPQGDDLARPHRERRAAADPARRSSWSASGCSPRSPGWLVWPPSTSRW